jgi:hypothetical protein
MAAADRSVMPGEDAIELPVREHLRHSRNFADLHRPTIAVKKSPIEHMTRRSRAVVAASRQTLDEILLRKLAEKRFRFLTALGFGHLELSRKCRGERFERLRFREQIPNAHADTIDRKI